MPTYWGKLDTAAAVTDCSKARKLLSIALKTAWPMYFIK